MNAHTFTAFPGLLSPGYKIERSDQPTPRDLRYYAAHEPRAADAVVLIRDALGLPSTDLAAFYLPFDDGRRWKQADTGLRAQWLGDWLRAEFYAVADECAQLVPMPAHMHGPCE